MASKLFLTSIFLPPTTSTKIGVLILSGDSLSFCNARTFRLVNLETMSIENEFLMEDYLELIILTKW